MIGKNIKGSLAWRNLVHDGRKLTVAIFGITFAVILMFQQRGFQDALFDSTVRIIHQMDCQLILLNPTRFALSSEVRFGRQFIDIVESSPAVKSVDPLYIENMAARLKHRGFRDRPIRVLAYDLSRPIFIPSQLPVADQIVQLRQANTAIMDRLSHSKYGFDVSDDASFPQRGDLSGKPLQIVGSFRSGRDFAHDGNLIMSLENFVDYFGYRSRDPRDVVDLGLVKLVPGSDPAEVARQLNTELGKNILVLTKNQFITKEINFWNRSTPIGPIFMIGTVMGFIVGVIICYQVLATNISDRLAEYATLKAMGYTNTYFYGLISQQAVLLAVMGFVPGLVLSLVIFQVNSGLTGLPMYINVTRAGGIFLATLLMCVTSGFFAVRKLLTADPASLF